MYFTSGSDRPLNSSCRRGRAQIILTVARPERRRTAAPVSFLPPALEVSSFVCIRECPVQPGKLTALDGAVKFQVKGVDDEMAVFRVEKNRGYTVMSNHHLRNKDLSLKAKGLLSQMLSLPEDWDFTLRKAYPLSTGSRSTRSGRRLRSWNRRAISCVPVSVTAKAACAGRITSFTNSPSLCRIHLHWKIQHWIIQRRKSLRRKNQRN